MQLRMWLIVVLAWFGLPALAAEEIALDYSYDEPVRVNFGNIRGGPLRLPDFSDSRGVENPNLIAEGYVADQPLAVIVHDALAQAIQKGNGVLVESGENLRLEGNVVSSVMEVTNSNGQETLQLTIRTEVKLLGSGRTMFQTTLFGRGTAPVGEGAMAAALKGALDRSIRSLIQDDYFLNEII